MDISVKPDGEDRFVVSCPANMEWDARLDLVAALKQASAAGPLGAVIIDLKNVSFMNSAGVGAIFKLLEHARQFGAKVVLSRPNPTIGRLLKTVNLPALAAIADSIEDARALVAGAAAGAA